MVEFVINNTFKTISMQDYKVSLRRQVDKCKKGVEIQKAKPLGKLVCDAHIIQPLTY